MSNSMIHSSLEEIIQECKGVLLDAYGVFWAGNDSGLLPFSSDAMKTLVTQGKTVGVLSNATRLSCFEIEKLKKHGLNLGEHFHFLITSGQILRDNLLKNNLPFTPSSNYFYVLGGPYPQRSIHDEIFEGTSFKETSEIEKAGFIYVSTPQINGQDQTDPTVFSEVVRRCADYKLPMLCANPDLFAHEGNPPKADVRQGSLAKMYQELGGRVYFVGKPHKEAFTEALNAFTQFGSFDPHQIVMIGDTMETDIRGANQFTMKSALITETGITADRLKESSLIELLGQADKSDIPHFFLKRLQI